MGPTVFGANWNAYIPTNFFADLFPISGPPTSLPSDNGLAAWNNLVQFMADKKRNKSTHSLNGMTSSSTETLMKKSTSAFAIPSVPMGGGFGFSGGWGFNAQHEVYIDHPVLATLCGSELISGSTNVGRYPVRSIAGSGDVMTTASFCSHVDPKLWGAKRYALRKFVDFQQFGSVLATWVSSLQNAFVSDPEFLTALGIPDTNSAIQPLKYQCPLTLQEMLLCLRNEIMNAFKDTQNAVQSLYPNQPQNVNDNVPLAYVASATTCSQGGLGMKLPLSFVENIRSLVARHVVGAKEHDVLSWEPVLGQFSKNTLNAVDYNFVINGEVTQTILSFAPLPQLERRRKDSKGMEMWEKVSSEPVISLIDGYTSSAPAGYVFINDQTRLSSLIDLWNEWLNKGLDAYCDPLLSLGTDTGVSIFCSVAATRHIITTESLGAIAKHADVRDARIESRKTLSSTPYSGFTVFADTFQGKPLQAVYESIMNTWILPLNIIRVGETSSDQTSVQRYQIYSGEGFLSSRSTTGVDGITLSSLNFQYAQKMVHAKGAPKNDWVTMFEEFASKGKAGVISNLLAQFAGAAFGGTVGSIATAIAGVLPF